MKPKLLTGAQAAAFLGVSPPTFRAWRKAGTVRPWQSSKYLTLYDEAHLLEVKAAREAKETK